MLPIVNHVSKAAKNGVTTLYDPVNMLDGSRSIHLNPKPNGGGARLRECILWSTVIVFLALSTSPAAARKQAAASKLPPGDQIVARSVRVTGGGAWDKFTSYDLKGTISIPARNTNGDFELEVKYPAKLLIRQKFAAVGNILQGFDGTSGWTKQGSAPSTNITGAALGAMKQQAALALRPGRWKTFYSGAETIGIVKVAKSDAYRVRMKSRSGEAETHYYDIKTGYEVRVDVVAVTPQGRFPVELYSSDYRTVGAVKLPFKIRQLVGPTEIAMQITETKMNGPVADSVFVRPN